MTLDLNIESHSFNYTNTAKLNHGVLQCFICRCYLPPETSPRPRLRLPRTPPLLVIDRESRRNMHVKAKHYQIASVSAGGRPLDDGELTRLHLASLHRWVVLELIAHEEGVD